MSKTKTRGCACRGKRLYLSYTAAVRGALHGMRNTGDSLRVYPCPERAGFHLTKQPKRVA